jgi:alcohol dehydrogenase (cytochrome c)
VDWCSTLQLATAPPVYTPGKPWLGSADSYGTSDSKAVGHVTALDIALGTTKWTYTTPTPIVAGVTATAGGLILTGDLDGNVYAFDERSGSVLKKIAVKAPVGGGVITYEYGSKQYIAVAAGLRSASWGTATSTAPAELVILGL